MGYSLDGEENVTLTGNLTLIDLPNGSHNLTVHANDTLGNMGSSETTNFTVAVPEPQPEPSTATPFAAAVTIIAIIAIVVSFLIYSKKRRRQKPMPPRPVALAYF